MRSSLGSAFGSTFSVDQSRFALSSALDDLFWPLRPTESLNAYQFYNLVPSLTARENVALVADIATNPMSPDDALAMVNLQARRNHFPSQLSGGEQQRVAIARAIVKRPEILLCDEPTGALDAHTGRVVLEVLDRVNHELHTSIAVVTHNAPIAQMADRVVSLADGLIVSNVSNEHRQAPSEIVW